MGDTTLKHKIEVFLAQDEPEYFEGVQLYAEYKEAKKALLVNFSQQYNKGIMQEKLVYELEKIIDAKVFSNRRTTLKYNAANIPFNIIRKVKVEAPDNYDYKIKFANLPEDKQKLVIEKGQLYTFLEVSKKQLASVGQKNDEQSIEKRQTILTDMHTASEKIKAIHAELVQFESGIAPLPEALEGSGVEGIGVEGKGSTVASRTSATGPEPISLQPEFINPALEDEFAYLQMSYYQLKDLLVKLRSSVVKQEQRAKENDKPEVKKKNQEKAELGRKMIALLVRYFEVNKEA